MVVKEPGAILLVSCYELGHQPLAVALPRGVPRARGLRAGRDGRLRRALRRRAASAARSWSSISVPMHTALRLGVARRRASPGGQPGLPSLLRAVRARSTPTTCWPAPPTRHRRRVRGGPGRPGRGARASRPDTPRWRHGAARSPLLAKLQLPAAEPRRPAVAQEVRASGARRSSWSSSATSRRAAAACTCAALPHPARLRRALLHRPARGRPRGLRQQVAAGATHVTFGDPDFLNGPGHALAVARALHAEFPRLTFDFTAKVEHLLATARSCPSWAELGCVVHDLGRRVAERHGADAPGEGPHAGRHRRAVVRLVRGGRDRAAAHLGRVHPVDDARRLPRDARLHRGRTRSSTTSTRFSTRSGCWCRPARYLLEQRRHAPDLGDAGPGVFNYRWTHPDPRMDALQRGGRAAGRAGRGRAARTPAATFQRVRRLADEAAGASPRPLRAPGPRPERPPRLTEPWFC